MRPMIDSPLPSITDTRYCIVGEIQRSMNEKFEISEIEKKENLTRTEEIRLKRRKRNDDLINLEQSVVLSEIHYLYFEQKKFRAGIYHDELRTDDYFERDQKGSLKLPLKSGQIWKKYDEYSEIKKYKKIENGSEERDVSLILLQLLTMAQKTNIPPLQKVIDHAMANSDEKERKEIFTRTLNINLTRHIKDWSELRENSRKELLHHSFRKRLENTLEDLSWIKIIEEDDEDYFFFDQAAKKMPEKDGPNQGAAFRKQREKLLLGLKNFYGDIQGYDIEYFETLQDLDENSVKKINAPQIFRSNVLETKLFPFLFKEEKMKLSIQDIYNLLQEYLERYISGIRYSISDIHTFDDGEENYLSDIYAAEKNLPDMQQGILRNDLISKLKNLDSVTQTKLNVIFTVDRIKKGIDFHKNALEKERPEELNKYEIIIKSVNNLKNFSPIGMNMRVNRIDELIEKEVVKEYFMMDDPIDHLISKIDDYLEPIVSQYPEEEKENILREIFDIFIENTMDNLSLELQKVA
jgi:hypothetical protein